ncbi:hypothetical protein GGG16DRAFT_105794 [Schizophyllum commune]
MHRHRQPAFNTDASASMAFKCRQCSRWLASAVNVFAGEPNATPSGKPNDILNFFAVPSHRWLARAENISRGSPMTQNPSTSMNSTSATLPTQRLRKSVNADASQVLQFPRARSMTQRTSSLNDTANEQLNDPLDVYPSSRALRHRLKAFRCYARASMSVPRKSINTTLCKSINVDALKSINVGATSEHQTVRETYHRAARSSYARRPGSSIAAGQREEGILATPESRSLPRRVATTESRQGSTQCPRSRHHALVLDTDVLSLNIDRQEHPLSRASTIKNIHFKKKAYAEDQSEPTSPPVYFTRAAPQ